MMTDSEFDYFVDNYLAPEWRQVAKDIRVTKDEWVHTPTGFMEAIIDASRRLAEDENVSKADDVNAEEEIAPEIIDKVCRKVIRRMKAEIQPEYIGDYDDKFNSYDALAFGYCCLGYSLDELNPHLEDYIYDLIDDCVQGTPIVNMDEVFERFMEMVDEHSQIKKIQNVCI